MAVPTKTPITAIQTGDEVHPDFANPPHDDLETNIDAILAYLSTQETNTTSVLGTLMNPLVHAPLTNGLGLPQGTGNIEFTRATTATYVDRYGVVQTAAVDEPRFEKNGLLIEGASTNLLTYSEQFDNGIWIKNTGVTVTPNAITAPDGTLTADKLVEPSGAHTGAYVQQQFSNSITTYTESIYAKAGERNFIAVKLYGDLAGWTTAYVVVNLTTGEIDNNGAQAEAFAVEPVGDGWFRISVTSTPTGTATPVCRINVRETSTSDSYTGDGTSGIYIWGAQLEEDLPFASSYIPTQGSAVIRSADKCYLDIENAPVSTLTICVDSSLNGDGSDYPRIIDISNVITMNASTVNADRNTYLAVKESDCSTFDYIGIGADSQGYGEVFRKVGVIDGTSVSFYTAGTLKESVTMASAVCPTYTGVIGIGCHHAGSEANHLFGHIRNLRIYDKALTPEEVRVA